nr:hypothetical protein [uncultured Acetatifactor sp.]
MENLLYYNQGRQVPDTAKKPIQGGRMNGKTDINPMWRIKKLTEMFGPCGIGWYYRSVREWLEPYEKSVAAFVKIELYVKADGEWSMPIQGTGGSMFVEQQRSGPYVSDECFKMATTDAISVACKQLGIGADVYWDRDESKYAGKDGGQAPPQDQEAGKAAGELSDQQSDEEMVALRKTLSNELLRTGYAWGSVMKTYKVDSLEALTKLMIKDCIAKMKKQPDKAAY